MARSDEQEAALELAAALHRLRVPATLATTEAWSLVADVDGRPLRLGVASAGVPNPEAVGRIVAGADEAETSVSSWRARSLRRPGPSSRRWAGAGSSGAGGTCAFLVRACVWRPTSSRSS
ncbi:MAG: hypothetical protein M0029_13975 [Actinomycetota bacterium]|nr:hypothetical protein [Actinomycetota bacterium]